MKCLTLKVTINCTKLLGDCKEFDPEILSCTTTRYLLGQDIWHFTYTFSNICRNILALGVRNALRSVESSIQVQFFKISSHAALLNTLHYYFPIWHKDEISAFEIREGLEDCPVSLGMRVSAASAMNKSRLVENL